MRVEPNDCNGPTTLQCCTEMILFLNFICIFFISPLDDMNTTSLTSKCSENGPFQASNPSQPTHLKYETCLIFHNQSITRHAKSICLSVCCPSGRSSACLSVCLSAPLITFTYVSICRIAFLTPTQSVRQFTSLLTMYLKVHTGDTTT